MRRAAWGWLVATMLAGQDRQAALDQLQRILLPSRTPPTGRINAFDRTWEDWVKRTGELPPDFASLPSSARLPDPLELDLDGRTVRVTTPELWQRKRQWIRGQVERWLFGTMPPKPDNLRAVVTGERREGTVRVRDVRLEFGPGHRATLRVQLLLPEGPGPFPVFLTNHARNRPWLYTALNRGYAVCIYFATDPHYGDIDDSDAFIEVYPEFDFTCLARWAWAASRAVDWLETVPQVDRSKIGLAGHSRGGKQALLAAAFDERIGAVIPSSGNTGEIIPWRFNTNPFAVESLELLTGAQAHWFHPRLHFFAGREDRLPIDQHSLIAMVAPRGVMMYSGYMESAANPLGFEQSYRSALSVYRLLGHPERLWLNLREGEHATNAEDIETFIDFFDAVFGRRPRPKAETWILGYDFDEWRQRTGERLDLAAYPRRSSGEFVPAAAAAWPQRREEIRERIRAMTGAEPPRAPFQGKRRFSDAAWSQESYLALVMGRPAPERLRAAGMGMTPVPYGDGQCAQLFYPLGFKGKLPVVVWLHPYAYATGWAARSPWNDGVADYLADQRPSFRALTQRGFAVLAFDQIGFGTRLNEARHFTERYPRWSRLGRMIADTRDAIEAVARLEEIDGGRIDVLGYALGAKVGLLTAAFDERIRRVVAVSGVDSLREPVGEGLEHYSHLHGTLPRLGFFLEDPARVPFDWGEVMAAAAPRRLLIVAPELDRYVPVATVKKQVEAARSVYRQLGAEGALTLETPLDINRFSRRIQERVYGWLASASE